METFQGHGGGALRVPIVPNLLARDFVNVVVDPQLVMLETAVSRTAMVEVILQIGRSQEGDVGAIDQIPQRIEERISRAGDMDFPKILFGNSFVLDKPMGVVPRLVEGKFAVHIEQVDIALIEILRQQGFQFPRSHYDLRI
jgi:hypothetical protein